MLQIKNSKTKQVKEVSAEDFEKIQKNELTKGKWFVIEKAKTPPEVKELEDKKKIGNTKGISKAEKAEEVK